MKDWKNGKDEGNVGRSGANFNRCKSPLSPRKQSRYARFMTSGKQPHILNASSNLVGICLVLVTGLKLTKASDSTWADEISVCAAVAFIASCVTSYLSMRIEKRTAVYENIADYLFLGGMFSLFVAVTAFAYDFL